MFAERAGGARRPARPIRPILWIKQLFRFVLYFNKEF